MKIENILESAAYCLFMALMCAILLLCTTGVLMLLVGMLLGVIHG